MHPSNSDQPPKKPNYDFIMDQAGPPAPKKRNNKVIFLFVLVVALVVVGIVGLLLAPAERVQQEELSQEEVSQQETTKQFMSLVNSGNNEGAYAMIIQEAPPLSKEEFMTQAVPFLKSLRLNECTFRTVDAVDATQETRPVATCYTIEGNVRIDLEFEISRENPNTIIKYRYIEPS